MIEPESGNGIAVVSNSDKAYYMTYELMEVWSQKVLGQCVADLMMYQMKKIFYVTKMVLLAFVLFWGIIFAKNLIKHRYSWKINSRKVEISFFVFSLFLILDGVFFYTDWIGKQVWGMENYYLFTFFPPDFLYIQIGAGLLVLMFLVRMNIKKRK